MKTNSHIKQEIINYLVKTSKHTFSYEDGKLFKVVNIDGTSDANAGFNIVDESSFSKVKGINIGSYIDAYGSNAKCVIKHNLFLNRKLKSVKTTKYTKDTIDTILDPSKKKVLI